MDLKIDDQTIQTCMDMYRRLNFDISLIEEQSEKLKSIEKFMPIYNKLEDSAKSVTNTDRIYIKRLNIEPINITLTFRAASKSDMTLIANNVFADFGLIFASIKDAGIELSGFKKTHVFGTKDLILKTVYRYFKGSVC
jgi:hypothetical protein